MWKKYKDTTRNKSCCMRQYILFQKYLVQQNLSSKIAPWAIKMWSLKTVCPWWQVQLYWNVGPSAWNIWRLKTGSLHGSGPKTGFTVPAILFDNGMEFNIDTVWMIRMSSLMIDILRGGLWGYISHIFKATSECCFSKRGKYADVDYRSNIENRDPSMQTYY